MNALSKRPQNLNFGKIAASITSARTAKEYAARVDGYNDHPKRCKRCGIVLLYSQRKNTFCSKVCSGLHNNPGRKTSDESKRRVAISLNRYHSSKPKTLKPKTTPSRKQGGTKRKVRLCCDPGFVWTSEYQFSRVKPCRICRRFMRGHTRLYCETCYPNISLYRARCQFVFNVYAFSDNFTLSLIEQYGWYSPGGNRGRNKNRNMTGVSRDHMFSISDGYMNAVAPDIMSHPANCELLLHRDNAKKHKNSSITLDELLIRIKAWNDGGGGMNRTCKADAGGFTDP